MALPFLALYLTQRMGFSAQSAGFVLTCYGLSALATAPFAGRLSDRIGPLRVMKGSLILSGVVLVFFPFVKPYALIIAATTLWSMVSEAFRPASLAIITDLVPPEQRKTAFALNRLAINLGMSIGPAAGGFLFLVSYHTLFWVDGATAFLAALLLLFTPRKLVGADALHRNITREGNVAGIPQKSKRSVLSDRSLLFFLAAMVPVLVIFFQHEAAMPLFMVNDLHLPESAYGLLFTINTGLIILIEVPLNIATAERSQRYMLALGALLVGMGFGAMYFVRSAFDVGITVAVWTFGEMILLPGAAAYMAEISPVDRRGEYMGLFQMAFSFAFALSGWLGTMVLEEWGAGMLWGGTLVAGCLSAAMLLRLGKPVKRSSEGIRQSANAP